MLRKLLITDLDNTLYNFIDFYAPVFRAMIHALSKKLNIEEQILKKEFRKVYSIRGSLEYAFSIQEIELFQSYTPEKIQELIDLARGVMSRVRPVSLTVYDGVKETLQTLKKDGIYIAAASNAPFYQAVNRLRQLHIEHLFDALVCWEGPQIPEDSFTTKSIENKQKKIAQTRIPKVWQLPKERLKPNAYSYELLISEFKVERKFSYVVGDSIAKDVYPAIEIGANGVWAKYGEKVVEKNLATILEISNWDSAKINAIYKEKHEAPKRVINSFAEILSIIEPNQLTLNL